RKVTFHERLERAHQPIPELRRPPHQELDERLIGGPHRSTATSDPAGDVQRLAKPPFQCRPGRPCPDECGSYQTAHRPSTVLSENDAALLPFCKKSVDGGDQVLSICPRISTTSMVSMRHPRFLSGKSSDRSFGLVTKE